ncbi:hypothetical protein GCM10027256_34350 [Novispirillum itersonii subsp. nipponicum]|uniref:DNA-directed RNA polymerase subunit RPC12/RpoP n=1 Tax=Novispirillum itersonii TaxID=189 RepID=A0A7W9ZEV4_NOVIT|nr:DNA-directed RNA polymerase subunit RPC12/RpoP [Novispirillum itersonii]
MVVAPKDGKTHRCEDCHKMFNPVPVLLRWLIRPEQMPPEQVRCPHCGSRRYMIFMF